MIVDLERREARLSVGEFSDFALGPRAASGSGGGLWRAQIGTRWHRELRACQEAADPASAFEVTVEGPIHRRGWTLFLSGRIDQVIPEAGGGSLIREIKTVTEELPVAEDRLRTAYPAYFVQAAAYAVLGLGLSPAPRPPGCELVFVEADTGLSQTVRVGAADISLLEERAALLTEFLDFRARTRERLRGLRFRPPFATLRPGQETAESDLREAVRSGRTALLLEAPTGFGKTGVLLAFALAEMREGRFERLVYVTGKSTGQIQVAATLAAMTRDAPERGGAPGGDPAAGAGPAVTAWHVRNKAEHCVNTVFHCVRDACDYLAGSSTRWAGSGLARFYLFENEPRDLETLRAAGRAARICPYEITRAALPFNDVWIGDYNYVFSPDSRGLFLDQPGYERGRTLLIVDEAHNLPARAADGLSHAFAATEARAVAAALGQARVPARLADAWDAWARFMEGLPRSDALEAGDEEEARDLLRRLSEEAAATPVDYAALGADITNRLWEPAGILARLGTAGVSFLAWSPDAGELAFTCLDAAAAIGGELRSFGAVVLATATPGPGEALAEACGLAGSAAFEADLVDEAPLRPAPERLGRLARKDTRRLFAQLASGTDLLRAEESRESSRLCHLRASAPWRDGAYDVAVDLRVDTTFHRRSEHLGTTAETLAALAGGAGGSSRRPGGPAAAFFPSYAYAEAVLGELRRIRPGLRAAIQPRRADLPAQAAWVEESVSACDALLLILGSGFTESIDLLGGRVAAALVAGPALPEVNAVQRARMAAFAPLGRDAAFDRTYRIPGMQKVNQALGRLVRAPGQTTRVLLHCRRFAEPGYARLLQPEYHTHRRLMDDDEFASWLGS